MGIVSPFFAINSHGSSRRADPGAKSARIRAADSLYRFVDLALKPDLTPRITNPSQIAGKLTERWVTENLYCPACPSDSLEPTKPGTKVVDFRCPECTEFFQLKSRSSVFRSRVLDSAYGPMIKSIEASRAPNFLFLHYDRPTWRVRDLFTVPRHFFSPSMVEKRPPLPPTARRAGWVGCNILISCLPTDSRIDIVRDEVERPMEAVREAWQTFAFLRNATPESRGWTADVLACVREVRRSEFALPDIYVFEDRLSRMHKDNRNVRPKIRQQLQVLRDHGILEFLGRGRYRVLLVPQLA